MHLDPHWRAPPSHLNRYRRWLRARGSLTRAIQARCSRFSVRQVRQRLALPNRDEIELLRLAQRERCVVREVLLHCGETPLVFAHSVLRRAALDGAWRSVAGLGARPLGAALFADPLIARRPMFFRRLDRRHALYRAACRLLPAPPRALWARRSLYLLRGEPLLVSEVFLPGILELKP